MRRSTVVILIFLLLWSAGVVALSVAVYDAVRRQGIVELNVRNRDGRVHVGVPAGFASCALGAMLWNGPGRDLRFEHEIHDWVPALRAALHDLERYDEVPLLAVDSGRDRVRVDKRGESISIRVENGRDESVSISMPAVTLQRALASID